MSLILDALNKSESERQLQAQAGTLEEDSGHIPDQEGEPQSIEPKKKISSVIRLLGVIGWGAVAGIAIVYYISNREPERVVAVEADAQVITEENPQPKPVTATMEQATPAVPTQSQPNHIPPVIQDVQPSPEPAVSDQVAAQLLPEVKIKPVLRPTADPSETDSIIKADPVVLDALEAEANPPAPVTGSVKAIIAPDTPVAVVQDTVTETPAGPSPVDNEVISKDVLTTGQVTKRFEMPPVKPANLKSQKTSLSKRALLPTGSSSEDLFRRGNAFAGQGLYSRAVEEYTKALIAKPDYLDAYFGRAWTHVEGQQYSRAIADFDQVIDLNPAISDAWYGRGWAKEQAKQNSAAIRDYERAVELTPSHSDADFSRGYLYFLSNRYQDAAQAFTSTLNNSTGELQQYSLLWLYLSLDRSGQDAPTILAPQVQKVLLSGWPGRLVSLYMNGGERDNVIQQIESGDPATQRERQCVGYFFLGQLALVSGDTPEAIRYFRIALASGATNYRQYAASAHELMRLGQ